MSFVQQVQRPISFYAYVGPRHVSADSIGGFGVWNWAANAYNPSTRHLNYLGQSSLTASINADVITNLITSGSHPSAAGLFVGPNADSEKWEYLSYKDSKANFERDQEPSAHTAGAPVFLWYPLTNNIGAFTYDEEMSDNMATVVWTGKLSGVQAPSVILRPEHLIAITTSFRMDDNELLHEICMLGLIQRVSLSQDAQFLGRWDIDITCTSAILQNSSVPGVRMGPLDIASQCTADASSSLGANWKLTLAQLPEVEAGTVKEIDIVEMQEDCGPQHMLDGNENTLWVSDGWCGPANAFANASNRDGWLALFVNPPPTALLGSRYIELIHMDALDILRWYTMTWYNYYSGATLLQHSDWFQSFQSGFLGDEQGLPGGDESGREERLIIAENAAIFSQLFPSARPKYLLDASSFDSEGREAVRRAWWEGGALIQYLDKNEPPATPIHRVLHSIRWGQPTRAQVEAAWEEQRGNGVPDDDLQDEEAYIDTTGIRPGQVMRMDLANSSPGYHYVHDYILAPGYVINNDPNQEDAEWLKITLPEMNHLLRDDAHAGDTQIYIVDAGGSPNVEGFSIGSSGQIYIDDELVNYSGRDFLTGRLYGLTLARAHKAKSKVLAHTLVQWQGTAQANLGSNLIYPFQDRWFDMATAGYPIERIEWGRGKYAFDGTARKPFIGSYFWRFSLYANAPTPTDKLHEEQYMSSFVLDSDTYNTAPGTSNSTGWSQANMSFDTTASSWLNGAVDFRPLTALMQIKEMWSAPYANGEPLTTRNTTARPRLNYVRVFVDRRYFDQTTWLDYMTGPDVMPEAQIVKVLQLSGQFSNLFQLGDDTYYVTRVGRRKGITDRDTAWRVASDMAEYGTCIVRVLRDGHVQVEQSTFLLSASHLTFRTYLEQHLDSLQVVNVRPANVGQIRLSWENGYTQETGIEYYPTTNRTGGTVVDVGPMLADDKYMAAVIAQNLYETRRFPYNVFVELSVPDLDVLTGEVHMLQYDFLDNGQPFVKQLYVESVSQTVQNGYLRTAIGYREIGRITP